jgi:transcriptional regulator with XRE-family HTH domain
MKNYNDILAPKIRRFMAEKGCSFRELGRKSGLAASTLSDIVQGRRAGRPEFMTVYGLAKVFGVTCEELLELEPLSKDTVRRAIQQLKNIESDKLELILKEMGLRPQVFAIALRLAETEITDEKLEAMMALLNAFAKSGKNDL